MASSHPSNEGYDQKPQLQQPTASHHLPMSVPSAPINSGYQPQQQYHMPMTSPPLPMSQGYDQQHQYQQHHYPQQQQATSPTTIQIINQQPQIMQQPALRDWSSSMFGCFNDFESCCCMFWFPSCYMCCSIAPRMNESCCLVPCQLAFGQLPMATLRMKMRATHNIVGDGIEDLCCSLWCGLCVMCQIKREMDFIEQTTGKSAF